MPDLWASGEMHLYSVDKLGGRVLHSNMGVKEVGYHSGGATFFGSLPHAKQFVDDIKDVHMCGIVRNRRVENPASSYEGGTVVIRLTNCSRLYDWIPQLVMLYADSQIVQLCVRIGCDVEIIT